MTQNNALDFKTSIINEILATINAIEPFDALEKQHIQDTLTWIKSGAPLFRIQKPAIPDQHLVAYFMVFDEVAKKVLLVDHKKAQLWLPTGGHVEIDEHPRDAALRECHEELGITAKLWHPEPIFLTSTVTVGLTAGHTDVSLWYVMKGGSTQEYHFDIEEFNAIKWFSFDEVPYAKSDPHMRRFMTKFTGMLS